MGIVRHLGGFVTSNDTCQSPDCWCNSPIFAGVEHEAYFQKRVDQAKQIVFDVSIRMDVAKEALLREEGLLNNYLQWVADGRPSDE